MSASREKKSRQENLAGGYVDPRTKREKDEQAKDRRSNALYIAIAVIFVIVGIVVTVANSKVIERNADAVTIGNETYTAADVSYFYNTIYSSFVSKNSYYLSVYGLDTSKSLKEQDCPINGSTWYDYFRDQALESLKSYALLAQKAEAEGFDASEEVEQSVQDTFADLDAAAASAGYTRAQHIKAVCGPLVNEKVFERRNDRARDTLPPELRRDVNALDLEGRLIDLLPRAAARRRTVLVCNDAAVKQMRQVVFGVAFFHITDEHEIILVQRSGQVVKILVFRVNKAKLQHGKILL